MHQAARRRINTRRQSKAHRRRTLVTASTPSVWKAGRPRRRLLAVFVSMVVVAAGLLTRVALLQTAQAADYRRYGENQRTRNEIVAAPRGIVFDRDGEALALSVPSPTIFANPQKVKDPQATATALAQLLGFTLEHRDALAADLASGKEFKYVARQIDDATAQAIMSLDLPGIGMYQEPKRVFPAGEIARGVIGKTDIDGVGIGGLEKTYQGILKGVDGELIRETDRAGRSIPNGERIVEPAVSGSDLVLTLSRPIQYEAEQALLKMVSSLSAKGGIAIVEDVKTGEIYAMASVRRDPESGEVKVSSANLAAVDAYEPGSVAKVITVAAALNEGTVSPDTSFEVPWRQDFSGTVLSDAEQHPTEPMSVQKILAKSSNIGTIKISQTIGVKRQWEYMTSFGLGSKTQLDFPGESNGILRKWSEWQGTERVTVAYGQGVAATGVQLISAVNTLANDGTYVAPKLVRSTIDEAGVEQATPPAASHQVVSPQVAKQMNMIMRDVVCKGTASRAQVPGYTIAGKTGTGYKAQPNGTYYDENGNRAYYASFVGFFPAEKPEVTVLVSIDEPPAGGQHFGGLVAAPVFAKIAEASIHELDIAAPTANGGCPDK